MQINRTKLNFTSRNADIRRADDLARKVNNEFPRISQTLIAGFKHTNEFDALCIQLNNKVRQVRNAKSGKFDNVSGFLEKVSAMITPIKAQKIGNCAESAQLAAIAAIANEIENATIASVKTPDGIHLDHAVLLVNAKKPYIIDAWLGFADYIPEAIKKYKGVYSSHFDFIDKSDSGIVFAPAKEKYSSFLRKPVSETDLKELKKRYPEFLL
ncbi:MAG: hypothetical protein IKU37_10350 [Candidatus Gastranaerophilales bacterium]|nr:hypothetical protein [Candidatus Gastranaerophilales bacterium]